MMMIAQLFYQSQRTVTSFFNRISAEELWRGSTSVRAAGRKSGRHKHLRKPKDLNRGQTIGVGRIRTEFPGLNTAVYDRQMKIAAAPLQIRSPDADYQQKLNELRQRLERKRGKEKVHPLERGYSGTHPKGRRFGRPDTFGDETYEGFDSVCLQFKPLRLMDGRMGRRRLWWALMCVGNRNGLAGWYYTKMAGGKAALNRTKNSAAKRLEHFELLDGRTIYQDFFAQCVRSRLYVRRMPEGTGLSGHRVVISICQMIGIKDLHCKVEGNTRNYLAITKAFFTGLKNQETFQQLAQRTGLHVVEFRRENGFRPLVRASPEKCRTLAEIKPNEVLDVEEMYGEARHPWKKPPLVPFYANSKGHLFAEWCKYPFRNRERVRLEKIADGTLPQGDQEAMKKWGEEQHAKVLRGEKPMPIGLCLPDLTRESIFD